MAAVIVVPLVGVYLALKYIVQTKVIRVGYSIV